MVGTSSAIFEPPIRMITLSFAPPTHHGVAASFLQLTQRLSATFFIALVTSVMFSTGLQTVTAGGMRVSLLICCGLVLSACALSCGPALQKREIGP